MTAWEKGKELEGGNGEIYATRLAAGMDSAQRLLFILAC